jgi:surface antigen
MRVGRLLSVRALPALVGALALTPPAQAASMTVSGLPRSAAAGDLIAITARVAGAERCTLRASTRRASARVAGAERVSFRFRARRGTIRLSLSCGAAGAKTGTLRVRSTRGRGVVGPISVSVMHAPAPLPAAPPSAAPAPVTVWLSPSDALARAQADWVLYGAAYLSVFRNGQCTDWVEQRRPDIVERATVTLWAAYLSGDQDAVANWNGGFWDDTARAAGIEVGTVPRAGAAVSFDPGTQGITAATGHIAYVESVADDGSFTVSEMNAPQPYQVTYRGITAAAIARGGINFVY